MLQRFPHHHFRKPIERDWENLVFWLSSRWSMQQTNQWSVFQRVLHRQFDRLLCQGQGQIFYGIALEKKQWSKTQSRGGWTSVWSRCWCGDRSSMLGCECSLGQAKMWLHPSWKIPFHYLPCQRISFRKDARMSWTSETLSEKLLLLGQILPKILIFNSENFKKILYKIWKFPKILESLKNLKVKNWHFRNWKIHEFRKKLNFQFWKFPKIVKILLFWKFPQIL